jgi:hypothetical protein
MAKNILMIVLIVTVLIAGGYGGDCSSQTNLIPNPGFEHDRNGDGIPDGWERKGPSDCRLQYETQAYRGKRAISVEGKGSWRCRLEALAHDRWYLFSLWVKRDGFRDGEYPIARLFDKEITFDELFTWGRWLRLSRLLYLEGHPKTDELAIINPGMRHKVWFDDVMLIPFTITPVYPKNGTVISQGPPLFSWTMPDDGRVYEIKIELCRNKELNKKDIYTTYSPHGTIYWLKVPLLPGTYTWRIRVHHNDVPIAVSQSVTFEVTKTLLPIQEKSQSSVSQRSINGFFPLGMYGATIENLSELKEAGFNCVQTYRRDHQFLNKFVKETERLGLKVLIPYPEREAKAALTSFLNQIKNSRAMLAWYLADEPEGNAVPPRYIWRWNQFLKHTTLFPGALVLVRADRTWEYAPASDIIMVDPYPIPKMPLTWLSKSIEEAKKWVGKKPVWAVIQAFDWSACPLDDDQRIWGRNPTYEEERCLSYLALVHGATGLFYYTFQSGSYRIKDYPGHWNDVKRVVSELRTLSPLLLAPLDSTYQPQVDPPQIHWVIKTVANDQAGGLIKKGHYLMAVNTAEKPLKATLVVPSVMNDRVRVLFEKRLLRIKAGKLTDTFEPYGVHIYHLGHSS